MYDAWYPVEDFFTRFFNCLPNDPNENSDSIKKKPGGFQKYKFLQFWQLLTLSQTWKWVSINEDNCHYMFFKVIGKVCVLRPRYLYPYA